MTIKFATLLMLGLLIQHCAIAQSQSPQLYSFCLTQAESEHRQCLRYSRYGSHECHVDYKDEKNTCWRTYIQNGVTYGAGNMAPAGRFEPIPIPQRPVYVLPGMR